MGQSKSVRPLVLVVEDDEDVATSLARLFAPVLMTVTVGSLADALIELENPLRFAGAVIDILLPDGSGLEALSLLRNEGAPCPALVLTAAFEKRFAALAQLHGAEFLPKPPEPSHLLAFSRRVSAFAQTREERAQRFVATFAQRHALTARETEVLGLAVAGLTRTEMLKRMGITQDTLKTHLRTLLRKTGEPSLAKLELKLRRMIHASS